MPLSRYPRAEPGSPGHHDLPLILHHLGIFGRRDLEDDLAAIGQPDVVRSVKPAVFQLTQRIVAVGERHAAKGAGGHGFDLQA